MDLTYPGISGNYIILVGEKDFRGIITMLFEQIAHNRRNTRIVVALFSILLLAVTIFLAYFNIYLALVVLLTGIIYVTYNYYHVTRYLMKVTNAQEVSAKTDPKDDEAERSDQPS